MPHPEISLREEDKNTFCDELARVFHRPADVKRLLNTVGYPKARIPVMTDSPPRDTWFAIFQETDNGIGIRYSDLLFAALAEYRSNMVFRDLAEHYGTGDRSDAAAAERATPATGTGPPSSGAEPSPPAGAADTADEAAAAETPPGDDYARLLQGRAPAALLDYLESRLGSWEDLSPFQQHVLRICRTALTERNVALIYAVTNSGKTTLARVAMNMALSLDSSAIMLLPTKALVAQEESEWLEWADVWKSGGPAINVFAASRDYPENDRPVSRGRYDVAVAIYEKLGVYLVSGRRPLNRTGVVVVDELQTLAEDSERAAKLEALLTMIKMLQEEEQPALIGLSATLTREATEALQSWLGATPDQVVVTNERPVPLDTYVVDEVSWRLQTDAHLLSMPGRRPPESVEKRHGLSELRQRYEQQIRDHVPSLSTGELAAALVARIMESDPDHNRRIICFVPSRTAARELSTTIQRVLKKSMGRTKGLSPWESGRFASESSAARDREQALYDKIAHSDLPERDEIIRGLKEGVAPHSSAYAAVLRRLLEAEFRDEDGLLRVLVATDTLAVGINLPADTVIATSISGYSGTPRKRRLLPPADLDNKGGRAGRRGKTARPRGEFYILVPGERELQEIEGLDNRQLSELSEIDGVFREFVTARTRLVKVQSKFRDLTAISGLVLQVLCQDGYARFGDRWHSRVTEILNSLLIAHEGEGLIPDSHEVENELTSRKLIVRRHRQGGERGDKLALSGLGTALGRSGLDLSAAADLERLARLACEGAGAVDLLWNACRGRAIQSVTDWLTLPPVPRRHHPSLKENVITMALAYCHQSAERRQYCAQFLRTGGHPLPQHLVQRGDPVKSKELLELLETDSEDIPLADVNALLRAVVAYEWSHGIPFGQIRARFSSAIHSDETQRGERPVELKLYYSDVEQLCEQVAGVIRAAADLSFTTDGYDHSGRMRLLAQEIEVGLPAWLAPVAKMRIPALHRQRLAHLWDHTAPDRLVEILDIEPLRSHPGITADDRKDARHTIERRDAEERKQRNRIARKWADQDIPNSGGMTFEDLAEELDAAGSSVAYLELFNDVVRRLGVEARETSTVRDFAISDWSHGDRTVHVKVPHEPLTAEVVASTVQDATLIIVRDVTPGAREALKQPTRARYVQPEHILWMLASLMESRGDELTSEELIHNLQMVRVSSLDADGWYLIHTDEVGAPPPFRGALPSLSTSANVGEPPSDDQLS
ncbi:DEAD/DEAH box helicase [Spirillospora sp. CA-255316]